MSESQLKNSSIDKIEGLVNITRKKQWITFLLIVTPLTVIFNLLSAILNVDFYFSLAVSGVLLIITIVLFVRSHTFCSINKQNMVEHINRCYPEFEESVQLLLSKPEERSMIQKLQFNKVKLMFDVAFNDGRLVACLPKVKFRLASILVLLSLTIFSNAQSLLVMVNSLSDNYFSQQTSQDHQLIGDIRSLVPRLLSAQVKVTAPKYTNIQTSVSKKLNLTIPEGALVNWLFEFSRSDVEYYLVGAGSEKMQKIVPTNFEQKSGLSFDNNSQLNAVSYQYIIEKTILQTSIYRIVYIDKSKDKEVLVPLPGVYSISVIIDKAPKIKLIKPNRSLVEIAKDASTSFSIEALIKDDYKITQVNILASVAKGSGEAVKFRDKQFQFERIQKTENGNVYHKHWSLTELDMEPGDEVYFSVQAVDNKKPKPQQTKSATIIVRWLDNEEVEMASEGLRIGFVAEYFRSQRQIIIETEQLIEDRKDLTPNQFSEVSNDLGYSQRELKEKFGQYLGDEIGEGPGEQFGLADGYHGGEDSFAGEASAGIQEHEGQHDSENALEHGGEGDNDVQGPEIGHVHEEMIEPVDLSGKSQIIAQFAHNHGTAEIGPISKRDPKSWMKQAVHEMWQAEMHLMLSEPEKALAYEYLAYKYLKLARQADRIYAKRLGFEPPPVSEDKRLTGELDDILNFALSVEDRPDLKSEAMVIKNSYQLLNSKLTEANLTTAQKLVLSELREKLLDMASTRPVLIKYAAIIEQILIVGKNELEDCEQCIVELKQKLWQLLPEPLSLPKIKVEFRAENSSATNSYLQKVKKIKLQQVKQLNAVSGSHD
jgi:hypothetical protein